jgi:acetyl-CoA carboxylase carboxyl transferase subunit beta
VIDQTIREKPPEGMQRTEFMKDCGMTDIIVHRHDLRIAVPRLCRLSMRARPASPDAGVRWPDGPAPAILRTFEKSPVSQGFSFVSGITEAPPRPA